MFSIETENDNICMERPFFSFFCLNTCTTIITNKIGSFHFFYFWILLLVYWAVMVECEYADMMDGPVYGIANYQRLSNSEPLEWLPLPISVGADLDQICVSVPSHVINFIK